MQWGEGRVDKQYLDLQPCRRGADPPVTLRKEAGEGVGWGWEGGAICSR